MAETTGVKNIEEVLSAFPLFIKTCKEQLGDGFQIQDSFAIFQMILGPQIQAAVSGAEQIKAEFSGMDKAERRQVTHKAVDTIYDVLEVFEGDDSVPAIEVS